MDKEINKVYSSMDYKKFKIMQTNRDLRLSHVQELKDSILENPLDKPIDVNENFEIIDGQHRFFAWCELNMPIIYIIHKGWGEKEVPILNSNQKNWIPSDYVKMYSESGIEDYKQYKEFHDRYGFTHQTNVFLLSGGTANTKRTKTFNEGKFQVKKWNWANIIAKQVIELKDYYEGFKRYAFVAAYVKMALDKHFNHTMLIQKLQFQSRKMVHCTTVEEYYELLREIYNFRTKVDNRINAIIS